MKDAILFMLMFLLTSKIYSQSLKIDEIPFDEISEINGISYTPTHTIEKTGFSIKKYDNKEIIIEFIFIIKGQGTQQRLHSDSILLQTTKSKIFLDNPIRDTASFKNDGSMYDKIFHHLSIAQFDLLKKEPVDEIILRYGNDPVHLQVKKRSQRQINRVANSL